MRETTLSTTSLPKLPARKRPPCMPCFSRFCAIKGGSADYCYTCSQPIDWNAIDRLVRDMHGYIAGIVLLEPTTDLLRGPIHRQLSDDHVAKREVLLQEIPLLWSPRSAPGTLVS